MTDWVSVANLTLQKIGAEDAISARDQQSHAARTVRATWDDVRRACLRGGTKCPRWNFAEKYHEVPARNPDDENPIPYGWTAAFPEPTGSLRLAEIVYPDCSAAGSWKVAQGEILLRSPGPLKAWFIHDVEEPALWDSLFVNTFAARLGYQVADRLTGDRARKKDCWDEYEANLLAAAKVDATENPPVAPLEDDWIAARFR